ncbi:MAG TPA: biotin/lipoyl-containing protein, partial [Candidatus Limnocylindrales bacterium]
RDLVADQLQIAAGEPLAFGQPDVRRDGHAIEVRLYAEDAEAGFLPATGRVEAIRWPAGDGVRVDSGIDAGSDVSARFDPLLAKVISWGADRPQALDRLRRALDETLVLGPITNLRFLRWLVRQPWIVDGQARVDTLESAWMTAPERAFAVPDAAWRSAAAAWAGFTSADRRAGVAASADPWTDGWRMNGPGVVRLSAEGEDRSVALASSGGLSGPAETEARATAVAPDGSVLADVDGRTVAFRLASPPQLERARKGAGGGGDRGSGGGAQVVAPMPGSVLAIHVQDGAEVAAGDPIATLEAMKMEHVVTAPFGGTVVEIGVHVGEHVLRGTALATVEP